MIIVTDGGDAGGESTCTLRQAIESANKNTRGKSSCVDGYGDDTIAFAEELADSTITLGGSELSVKSPLTIDGTGQTIDADHASRVMYVGFTSLDASNINLVNGTAAGNSGGGLFVLTGTVNLTNVGISANSADYAAGIAAFNYADLTLSHSTVTGNSAARKGGGVEIVNGTQVRLYDTTVAGNIANRGGGIFVSFYGEVKLSRSTVSGNTAAGAPPQSGGGIYGYRCGYLSVVDSTVSGNVSNYRGGGILAIECPLALVNATVTGNSSINSGGGAIYLDHSAATMVNSTIAANSAHDVGGLRADHSTVSLDNSIVSANTVDAAYAATADLAQYDNSSIEAHYSLLGNALDTSVFNDAGLHNVFLDDPGLGPLQDNGGPTQTMAALDGSAVIDAGSNALAEFSGHALVGDQRGGYLRVANGTVDIGAFEFQPDRIFAGRFEALP